MTSYQAKFELDQKVTIHEIETDGYVTEVSISRSGTVYRVNYFFDGKLYSEWLLEVQLSELKR